MQGLTASIVPAAGAVVFLLSYPLLRHLATATDWRPSVPTLFVAWLCAYLLVYFLCGPASFIAWDGEGNLAVAMHHYMATGHDGGRFSHAIGGGQDMYTWFVGMQFLNPEPLLFHVFPTWVAVLAHKAAIGALGFVGSYLLARRVAPHSSMLALALAMLYPVSHDYLLTYSTEFGTGFAAIPLVVHLCVARTGARTYWPWVFVAATIIAAAEPMKVFPALLVAYVGVAVLLPGVSLRRAAAGFPCGGPSLHRSRPGRDAAATRPPRIGSPRIGGESARGRRWYRRRHHAGDRGRIHRKPACLLDGHAPRPGRGPSGGAALRVGAEPGRDHDRPHLQLHLRPPDEGRLKEG
ncbi:MAG: hypothetical protein HQL34_08405 [Alphaproteobacteria bacterium]|nr:hypothetical protein [Alphaproteobacteria bacterium]